MSRRIVFASALALLALPAVGRADDPAPPDDGLFVTVSNPITTDVVNRIEETIDRARNRAGKPVRKVVLDFNPDKKKSATKEYGPCYELAKYLQSLQDVFTVAFVQEEVSRHTVLPVLACKELVMAPGSRIGEIVARDAPPPPDTEIDFYVRKVARPALAAVVLKMADKNAEVKEGRRNGSVWYFDKRREAEEIKDGVVGIKDEPIFPAGTTISIPADQAARIKLCKSIRSSRQEVAETYQMSPNSLREDPLQGREPVAWKIDLRGPVNKGMYETLQRRLGFVVSQRANIVFIQIECQGGDTDIARKIADYLRGLKDDNGDAPVMTVGFVAEKASDTATIIALGCTELVMGKDAEIGDFEPLLAGVGKKAGNATNPQFVMQSLQELAALQGISPLIIQGMFDRDLVLYRVRSQGGAVGAPIERRLITGDELEEDHKKPIADQKWVDEGQVKAKGQLLKLNAAKAKELGVARYVVENPRDLKEVYAIYVPDTSKVREAGADWLDRFAAFLRNPYMSFILVMIGLACLILEFKLPGATLPGIVAALCFVLFFWSQFYIGDGQIIMLAIMLFVLGLILLGLEIFVIPGFGITGVSGIICLLAGLALATMTKVPQTSGEWMDFGTKSTQFALGLVGALVGAFSAARYLPNVPYANRLVLSPPADAEAGAPEEPSPLPGADQAAALLGAIGVAATALRPAGMARIGDNYVDVVTEGGYVPAGARLQVIEVEGTRVVVKEV
jgi:membrane-bound ClpP family serine protease